MMWNVIVAHLQMWPGKWHLVYEGSSFGFPEELLAAAFGQTLPGSHTWLGGGKGGEFLVNCAPRLSEKSAGLVDFTCSFFGVSL